MKNIGWGNLRINFQVLLIAIFCIQISSSFAVANSVTPTNPTIAATQAYSDFNPSFSDVMLLSDDVIINGETSPIVNITESIDANSITMQNVTASFINNQVFNYNLDNLEIRDDVKFLLDVDLENAVADNVSAKNSHGTMYISELNFITPSRSNSTKIQILKISGITLNIDNLSSKHLTSVQPTMYNDNILANAISLGKTSFANDSIVINGWKDVLYELVRDNDPTRAVKRFVFRTDSEYIVKNDLEPLAKETSLTIVNESGADYGVLNANNHSMFKLDKHLSKVNLNNVLLKNAFSAENGAVAKLENSTAVFSAENSVITDNRSDGNGGAFYVKNGILSIKNSTVSNNTSEGNGGAIYTEDVVEIIADNGTTTFENNNANGENNAIYVGSNRGAVYLNAQNGGVINMNDKIDGTTDGYKLNVNGDTTGKINLNNTVSNATIQLNSGVLIPQQESYLDGNNFIGNGGLLMLQNGSIGTVALNEVSILSDTKVAIDADLAHRSVDRITSTVLNQSKGVLSISNINVLSDSIPEKITVSFAEGGIKDAIKNSVNTAYSRIYKYSVSYNKSTGELTFNRGGGRKPDPTPDPPGPGPKPPPGPNPAPVADMFNPAILAAGVAQQVAYMNQLQNYQNAMYHLDSYMMLPKSDRILRNKTGLNLDDEFKYCSYQAPIQDEIRSIWVRPYSMFESVPLKRGVNVTNISYGTLFGGDSDLIKLKHGFNFVYGGYVGYNGNTTTYSGIDSNQQGAVVGASAYIYKGNFFNAITANCGWQINESYNMYGHDTMNLIMSGVADRIGYNLELAAGKFIIQPSIFIGYSFVYSSDYTMNSGVRIKTDPLNVIHFAPTLKFIGNTKNGWQPYAIVTIMANFMDKTEFTANNIRLPQMSIDPYVEYGVGIQRRWNEKCQAFGQATVRNGGRRGVALLFGFKYMIGKIATVIPMPKPIDRITSKKVIFKERKSPDIEVLDWRNAKKEADKRKTGKPRVAKKGLFDRFKSLIKYNTDVSAEVISDVYSDGVIMTSLKGLDKNGTHSTFVDLDMQRPTGLPMDVDTPTDPNSFDANSVIIIDDIAFNHTQQPIVKHADNTESASASAPKQFRKADIIKKLNKKYIKFLKVNQTNYYKPEKKYEFSDYKLEIIKF